MDLKVKRIALKPNYTIGKLYINEKLFCDTLEDPVRDLNRDGDLLDAGEEKVYGNTAIPFGKYKVILNESPKFKRTLPRLLGVKHFDGILIHAGNTAKDTHGCILVGKNSVFGKVLNSRRYEKELVKILQEAIDNGEKIVINIV